MLDPIPTYAGLTLISALIPTLLGLHAWGRRGKPGAVALALVMWSLALWGVLHAAELATRSYARSILFYEIGQIALLAIAPLWIVFTLQYTGRERWLTRWRMALLAVVPLATLALILVPAPDGLMWSMEGFRSLDGPSILDVQRGPWFWVDFAYRALLITIGSALLTLMLVNSQRLYGLQSMCLIVGFLIPWTVVISYQLGFAPSSALSPVAGSFLVCGAALTMAFARYRLLDISPVAHDAIVEGMSDGTVVLDRQNRIVDINPAAARILGCPASEAVGRDFRWIMSSRAGVTPLPGNQGSKLLERYEKSGRAQAEISTGDGEGIRHYDLALSALYDARDRRTGALVVLHEVTERRLAVERLDKMAHYDVLTGLPNRTFFHERFSQEIARSRRNRKLLALFFLDLDRFKTVNDTLGHEIGDLLLKETAARLSSAVREYDVVARLAGDEFTVILPDVSEAPIVTSVAERIIEELAKPYEVAGNELRISASVGICFYPTDGTDPSTLMKNADQAMYRAKIAGKNRYELFTGETPASTAESMALEADLTAALDRHEVVLRYRPEMSISTSRMLGVETLPRWERPGHEPVTLGDIMPLAEQSGIIFALERWILRESCRQMRSWHERYPAENPLTVAVDVSARYFSHPNLVGEVSRALEDTTLSPECLVLQVQESILNDDPASAAVTLHALEELGVKLAVCGFGAGSSSLAQLKQFPLHVLKIDGSFTAGIDDSPENRLMVSAMVSLAHALNLKAVATGVDNPRQLMRLKEMGCDVAQGAYFAESLSHRETAAFLVADLYY